MPSSDSSKLDLIFKALSDPTRRLILDKLRDQDLTLLELEKDFDMTFQAVSKHLKVLEKAGLLEKVKNGKQRICQYKNAPMEEAWGWLSKHYDLWKDSFQSLESYLNESKEKND